MGQFLADLGLVQQKLAVNSACVDLLRQQQLHGEMPAAGVLDDFPDLAGLAGRHDA